MLRHHTLAGWPLLLVVVALFALGCNSSTDDPDTANSQLSVTALSPSEACVDWDGTEVDTNGDGTFDGTAYLGTTQVVNFQSIVRGSSSDSPWNDIVLTECEISYKMDYGFPPPPRRFGVQVAIPANGTGSVGVTTVDPNDIPAFFGPGDQGTVILKFYGEDAGGHPASAVGSTRLLTATECD